MRTLAVTSGKGGVGKTTLSLNLGIALAKSGKKVIVFDCDFALANLDLLLKIQPEFNLRHVLAGEKTLSEIVYEGPFGVGIIAGGSAIGSLVHAGPKRLNLFLEQIQEFESNWDYVIFDTGAGIDRKVMTFLRAAHDVLIVTTPDPASVTDSYAISKVLFRHQPDARVHVFANMVASDHEGHVLHKTLEAIAQRFIKHEIKYLGSVRTDLGVAAAVRNRNPFVLENPAFSASKDISNIAMRIQGWENLDSDFYQNFRDAALDDEGETINQVA